jgi:hypothetical protein
MRKIFFSHQRSLRIINFDRIKIKLWDVLVVAPEVERLADAKITEPVVLVVATNLVFLIG